MTAEGAVSTVSAVFGTVGTDHHPFDRLVAWLDDWASSRPDAAPACLVQYGTSSAPTVVPRCAYLPFREVAAAMSSASAVVCHGGPSTILECRTAGMLPIVVPRRHALGEHVDDHQVVFTRRMASLGEVVLAEDEAGLHRLLDHAIDEPDAYRLAAEVTDPVEAVRRFTELVGSVLLDRPPRSSRRARLLARLR